jgi:hypothetical protein
MRKGLPCPVGAALVVAALALSGCGSVATQAPSMLLANTGTTQPPEASGFSGTLGQPTADLQSRAAQEARIAGDMSPAGLYDRVSSGELRPLVPPILGAAINQTTGAIPSRLIFVDGQAQDVEGVVFEEMMWTDGIGYVLVFWQEWPPATDPSVMTQPGASLSSASGIDYVIADKDLAGDRYRLVRIFDGSRVLSVESWNVEDMSVDQLKTLATAIFERLP